MLAAAEAIVELVSDLSVEQLEDDRLRRAAVLWHFTVLGEASSQLAASFRAEHPEIPWSKASRLRNRIVHGYWSISVHVIHSAATIDLPPLVSAMGAVLESLEPLPVLRVFVDDLSGVALWEPAELTFPGDSLEEWLGLSRETRRRIDAWVALWEDEVMSGRMDASDHDSLGVDLAARIQRELVGRFVVRFEGISEF